MHEGSSASAYLTGQTEVAHTSSNSAVALAVELPAVASLPFAVELPKVRQTDEGTGSNRHLSTHLITGAKWWDAYSLVKGVGGMPTKNATSPLAVRAHLARRLVNSARVDTNSKNEQNAKLTFPSKEGRRSTSSATTVAAVGDLESPLISCSSSALLPVSPCSFMYPLRHRSGPSRRRDVGTSARGLSFLMIVVLTIARMLAPATGLVIEEPFQGTFDHVGAAFGPDVLKMDPLIESRLMVKARPRDACDPFHKNYFENGAIALVERGTCNFTEKVLNAQEAGASAVVVTDTRSTDNWVVLMYGSPERAQAIEIPAVLVSHATGERLWNTRHWILGTRLRASLNATGNMYLQPQPVGALEMVGIYLLLSVLLLAFSGVCGLLFALAFSWYHRGYRTRAMRKLKSFTFHRRVPSTTPAAQPPTGTHPTADGSATVPTGAGSADTEGSSDWGSSGLPKLGSPREDDGGGGGSVGHRGAATTGATGNEDNNGLRAEDDLCAICLDAYAEGDTLTRLPCRHSFHTHCIRPWLSGKSALCPMCKCDAFAREGLFLTVAPRLEAAFSELAALCTENLAVLGIFFLASVACGVIAARLSLRD